MDTWITVGKIRLLAGVSPMLGLLMAGAGDKAHTKWVCLWWMAVFVSKMRVHLFGSSVSRGRCYQWPSGRLLQRQRYVTGCVSTRHQSARHGHLWSGPVPAQGLHRFSKSSGTPRLRLTWRRKGLPVVNEDGTPKWRIAPSPCWAILEEGMKKGLSKTGALGPSLNSTPRRFVSAAMDVRSVHNI